MSDNNENINMGQTAFKVEEDLGATEAAYEPSARDLRRLEKSLVSIKKVLHQQTHNALEVGRLLVEAKADLDRGYFLDWIDRELQFGRRMGQLYMRIHTVLSQYSNVLGGFQLNTLGALAGKAISDEHREMVVSEMDSGALASDEAVMARLRSLVAPDHAEKVARLKADRAVARKQVARYTYDLAGERVSELIELLRAAGLSEFADTLEEVVTEPELTSAGNAHEAAAPSTPDPDDEAEVSYLPVIEGTDADLPDFLAPAHI